MLPNSVINAAKMMSWSQKCTFSNCSRILIWAESHTLKNSASRKEKLKCFSHKDESIQQQKTSGMEARHNSVHTNMQHSKG